MAIRSELDVAVRVLPPYVWEEVDPISDEKIYQGITFSSFKNVTQSLNITLNLHLVTSGPWGSRLTNGTYIGQQRMVYEGEVDVSIGPFFQSAVTSLEMEPGFPHLFTKYCFISGLRSLYTTELAKVPFDTHVSMCILALCAFIPLLFYITQRGNPRRMDLFECFFLSSSVFLQDPIDTRRFVNIPSRITLVSWSFCAYIIVQIVAGILRSNTAVKTPVRTLDTFQQIIDNPKLEPIAWAGTPTMIILEEIRGEPLRKINERIHQMNSMLTYDQLYSEATLTKILDGKAVFIQEPETMFLDFPPFCDRYQGYFHINENDYVQSELVWYYAPKLDKATRRAITERTRWTFESGIPWVRERERVPMPPKCFTFAIKTNALGGTDDTESFSMVHLLPFFFIWFLGLGSGVVAFIAELLRDRIVRQSSREGETNDSILPLATRKFKEPRFGAFRRKLL